MPLLTKNVTLGPALRPSTRRKIAFGTWDHPGDPTVYGMVEFDASHVLQYIEKIQNTTNHKITISHFIARAAALMMEKHPQINCLLRFGKLYPRKTIDICFLAAADHVGNDLSALLIRNADKKNIVEIATDMQDQVDAIRKKGDPTFRQLKKTLGGVPALLVKFLIRFSDVLMYTLNLWSPLLGSPKDAFGGLMISNIGAIGLDMAFPPIVPYSNVPMLLTIGAVKERPIVKNNKIEIAPTLQIYATFDHRVIDGVHAAHMVKSMRELFEHPEWIEKS